jgi:hypothetical protein
MVTISIPTRQRPDKLRTCLNSILTGDYQDVLICITCTSLSDVPEEFTNNKKIMIEVDPAKSVVQIQNDNAKRCSDYYLPLADDVEFFNETLARAVEYNAEALGLPTKNIPGALDSCWTLMKKSFVLRFPGMQVFYPKYHSFFCDEELGLYAKSLGVFKLSDYPVLHHHPNFGGTMDDTHKVNRIHWQDDFNLFVERQAEHKLWCRDA